MATRKRIKGTGTDLAFWIIGMCVLVLGAIVFGSLCARVQNTGSGNKVIHAELTRQKANLLKWIDFYTNNQVAESAKPTFTGRVELTDELRADQAEDFCGAQKTSTEPSNELITFSDSTTGVSFQVPYNKDWGYDHCYLSPVSQDDFTLSDHSLPRVFTFGDLSGSDRMYELKIVPVMSESALKDDIVAWNSEMSSVGTTTRRIINGLTVLDYQVVASPYPAHLWDAIGRNFLYRIKVPAQDGALIRTTDAEVVKIIQSIKVAK